jgi:uncharacterized protein (TIGR00255 family)
MTGYGQGTAESDELRVAVDLRSVNNRFSDLRVRAPGELGPAAAEVRRRVAARIRRGRVEMTVRVERLDGAEGRPSLNRALLDEVMAAASTLREELGTAGEPATGQLLAIPGMFRVETAEVDWDEAQQSKLYEALGEALDALDEDRRREGAVLARDLLARVARLKELSTACRARAGKVPERVRQRLLERLEKLGAGVELDPARVAQEAVLLADKADVTEELVRLDGHVEQAERLLSRPDGKPMGKRLDFLLQELQREANTLGNKSPDLELTQGALDLKTELERIREQAQNLE